MPKIFEELDRQVDKWEPTAAAIGMSLPFLNNSQK